MMFASFRALYIIDDLIQQLVCGFWPDIQKPGPLFSPVLFFF